jgi:predicted type IV restriction endonuclease
MIAKHITEGSVTKAVVEQIRSVIPKALDAMLKERIQDKLNIAFRPEAPAVQEAAPAQGGDDKSEVVTTQDELQAFYIVRAIGAKILPVDRIVMRDAKSYCSVIVDDNNRKPVCRFYFNSKSGKSVGVFNSEKAEAKFAIDDLSQLFEYSEKLEEVMRSYLKP